MLALVLFSLVASVLAAPSCTFTLGGVDFDLSWLNRAWDYTGQNGDLSYSMNVCAPSNNVACAAADGAVCEYADISMVTSLGSWDEAPAPVWSLIDIAKPHKGPRLTYTNGLSCFPETRTTIVWFQCSAKVEETLKIVKVGSCYTLIMMNAGPAACGLTPPPPGCVFELDGYPFNLTSLARSQYDGDYKVKNGSVFSMNPCQQSTHQICSSHNAASICEYTEFNEVFSLGSFIDPFWSITPDGVCTLLDGEPCEAAPEYNRATWVFFNCSETSGTTFTVETLGPCVHTITMFAREACYTTL